MTHDTRFFTRLCGQKYMCKVCVRFILDRSQSRRTKHARRHDGFDGTLLCPSGTTMAIFKHVATARRNDVLCVTGRDVMQKECAEQVRRQIRARQHELDSTNGTLGACDSNWTTILLNKNVRRKGDGKYAHAATNSVSATTALDATDPNVRNQRTNS
jgi:hypothetical protein